jgi:hypothetical protein
MDYYLEKNKPLFHYFLSGFLGKDDPGSYTHTVIEFLELNNLYNFYNNDLNLIKLNTDVNKHKIISKKITKNKTSIILQLDKDYTIIKDLKINKTDFETFFDKSIFVINQDTHSTNLLFFINNNNLFILSINSGLGIDNHISHDGYYSPYYCLKIDYSDKNINEIVYNIISIIDFSNLYYKLRYYLINDDYDKIIELAKFLKIYDEINDLFYKCGVKIERDEILTNIKDYISKDYYYLFINYLNKTLNLHDKSSEFNQILIEKNKTNYDNLSDQNLFIKNDDINTNKRLYLKHRLYLIHDNIYIHEQENGSCTFYSLYWAILINSLFNDGYDSYVKMIKKFEKVMFDNITLFLKNIKIDFNYNYSLYSTILNKLSNLNILSKKDIDIHDIYLYKKEFSYKYLKSETLHTGLSSKKISFQYSDSLKFILIPPTDKIIKIFKEKVEPLTYIFLRLYNCFKDTPDIFDISHKKFTNYYVKLKKETETNPKFTENDKVINNNILTAYTNMIDYLKYPSNHLNIYSIQYYYIAKSICENDYKIIDFCSFIYKFYLFNKLFRTQIFKTLYSYPKIKQQITDSVNDYKLYIVFIYLNKNMRRDIIKNTLVRMNIILDFELNEDDFDSNNINFFLDDFFDKLSKNSEFGYLDGFTINFNFPNQIEKIDKNFKDMIYPKEQLDAMTHFLYKYPEYLYYDFNARYFFNINYFVETNIKEILGNYNYKNKLDNCYRWLFYNAVKNNITSEINYFGKKIFLLNNYSFQSNDYDFRKNRKTIDKQNELINKLKDDSSKGYTHFSTLEIKNYDIILRSLENGTLNEYINVIWSKEFKLLFNTDDKHIFINEKKKSLYIFYENYYLFIYYKRSYSKMNIQILNIAIYEFSDYNDIVIKHDVLNRVNIDKPFKYFIPSACLSLIYKQNDKYNVLCIASNFNNKDYKQIFGKMKRLTTPNITFNYAIESSNLLTLSFDKNINQIQNLNYFINNYGINNLNYIYFKKWNTYGYQQITKNDFNLLCLFNSNNNIIDYNIIYSNKQTSLISYLSDGGDKYKYKYINYSLFNDTIFSDDIELEDIDIKLEDIHIKLEDDDIKLEDIDIKLEDIDIKLEDKDNKIKNLIKLYKNDSTNNESIKKLLFKLSKCILNQSEIKSKLIKLKTTINTQLIELDSKIKFDILNNKPIIDLIFDSNNIIKYTYLNKLDNICNELFHEDNSDAFCSKFKTIHNLLKIRKYNFRYAFEYIFEYILGINVLDEQINSYINIINHYNNFKGKDQYIKTDKEYELNEDIFNVRSSISFKKILQIGGNYPLHHIMMGKGKSAVLTPLLSLYFCLIEKQKVFIIVPEHLKIQTNATFNNIIKIFELDDKIIIKSDRDIKFDYLNGKTYDDSIFLIDEFDTILDPLKSNFNLTNIQSKKNLSKMKEEYTLLTVIIELIDNIFKNIKNINDDIKNEIDKIVTNKSFTISKQIVNEIVYVLLNIKNNILKYNIKWGIHPEKGYAIPYMGKDTPLIDSNFNSLILILVLTYYYYYIELYNSNKSDEIIFNDNLVSTVIYHKLQDNIINYTKIELLSKPDIIQYQYNILPDEIKKQILYDTILPKIINSIEISTEQYNLSFVDIINIPNVYKIGYSGTLNINLPDELESDSKFTKEDITEDLDEKYNVYYSLLLNPIIMPNNDKLEKELNTDSLLFINTTDYITDLNNHDAIIDTAGLFRYEQNNNIAKELNKKLNNRPIIFLNNDNDILVYHNEKYNKYDPNTEYKNAFFYYSQKHTIGIDINQNKYPILKGICLIDNFNTYTEVAQSVFRLRKLNQGHTIQLYSININYEYNKKDVTDILVYRDDENKKLKFKNLTYQIIKANVRANRKLQQLQQLQKLQKLPKIKKIFNEKIKEIFNEKIKHIFMEDDYDNIEDNQVILKGILNDLEIQSQQKLIDIILLNEPSKLKELVYNINSSSCAINEEKSTQINMNIDQSRINQIDYRMRNLDKIDYSKYSHNYKYDRYKKVINYKIHGLDNVLFNPSILTTLDGYFNPLLLVIKKDNLNIIIIPSTDIYLYSNDLILNILGNSINYNSFDKTNIDKIIELQKNSDFIKFLSNDIDKFDKKYQTLYYIFLKINGVKKNINCNDVKNIESIFKNIYSHRLKQEIERVIRDPNSS